MVVELCFVFCGAGGWDKSHVSFFATHFATSVAKRAPDTT